MKALIFFLILTPIFAETKSEKDQKAKTQEVVVASDNSQDLIEKQIKAIREREQSKSQ